MAKVVDEITFRFYSPEDLPESGRKVLAYLKGGELVSGATTSKRYFFTGGDSENEVLYCTKEQFRENVKSWCYCDLETVAKGAVA